MKKLIYDNMITRIYDEGHRDLWGNKVLKRYPLVDEEEVDLTNNKEEYPIGIFVYKSTKNDRKSTIRRLGKNTGTPLFYDCPTEYVVR